MAGLGWLVGWLTRGATAQFTGAAKGATGGDSSSRMVEAELSGRCIFLKALQCAWNFPSRENLQWQHTPPV